MSWTDSCAWEKNTLGFAAFARSVTQKLLHFPNLGLTLGFHSGTVPLLAAKNVVLRHPMRV